ncbi:MAG: hypothetical protein NC126_12630 [Clostridium sp.]|nr:hypothetical protein [Clostridium sp.]
MKKQSLLAAAILSLMLLATGCGKEKKQEPPSLYDKGLSCVTTLSQELNEEYIGYFTSYEFSEIVTELAKQDYSQPESVYELKYPDGGLKQLILSLSLGDASTDDIPDAVLEKVAGLSYLANMINARMGTNYLALSSILSADELFVNEEVTENTAYLYFYKNAYPVMVSFRVGEDGAIHATGSYIFSDEMKDYGGDCLLDGKQDLDFVMLLQFFEIEQIR